MKNIFIALLYLAKSSLFAQNVTISGYMTDAKTGESLIGASVFVTNEKNGTVTNDYGFYSVTVKRADTIGIVFSYIGYTPQVKALTIKENLTLNILMLDNAATLGEVTISAKKNDDNVQRPQMGVIDVPMRQINTLPAIAGEKDILKIIQFLPGVQAGSEGTTGFFVRGGNIDQNLILLDEATVYNPSHLFGLFSTFNTRAIKNVSLVKGGFPAQYGGRLSSILDITMKDGNNQSFHTEGSIGLISSQLTFEGPITKDKGSFIVSARRSYLDLLTKPFLPATNQTIYYFYDLNVKANYQITPKDKVFLSLFKGRDKAQYTSATSLNYGINFGNSTGTLRWNHLWGSKLFSNTSLIFNKYNLNLSTTQNAYVAQIYSGISDVNAKTDFEYFPSQKQVIKAGLNYTSHTFTPISTSAKIPKTGGVIAIQPDSVPKRYATEGAIYANDDIAFSNNFSFSVGVRVPFFIVPTKTYTAFEPRLTAKLSLDKTTSVKASYTEMNQFLHLVPSSSASLPTDIWVASSAVIKPQVSKQIALGLFKNFEENTYETSLEFYYKNMDNQVLFKEGTKLTEQSDFDKTLTFGKGISYGAEVFVKKNTGKLTGWVAYTLSKTDQTFAQLNNGQTFPFAYDKRHNLSVVGTYEFSPRWTFSADFVFATGGAFTLPNGRLAIDNGGSLFDGVYSDYVGRNNYRYRSYHRLDVSFAYKKERKFFGRKYQSEWTFGAYNVYSRLNPYFVYLTVDKTTGKPTATQVSLLPIIPSVSFDFKF